MIYQHRASEWIGTYIGNFGILSFFRCEDGTLRFCVFSEVSPVGTYRTTMSFPITPSYVYAPYIPLIQTKVGTP